MKLIEATKIVKEMIAKHVPGTEFAGYTSSKRSLGVAGISGGKQYIKLSSVFVQIADEKAVRNTIAHECAHLLAYRKYGTLRHDKYFYKMCEVTGATPERLNSNQQVSQALASKSAYRLVIADASGKIVEIASNTYQKRPRKDISDCWLGNNRATLGRLWYCETKNAQLGKTITKGLFFQK